MKKFYWQVTLCDTVQWVMRVSVGVCVLMQQLRVYLVL